MSTFNAKDFPRFKVLSYEEIELCVERGRALRSAAAYGFFAGLFRAIAGGVRRAVNGLRQRDTTHWPARLDPGHKAG